MKRWHQDYNISSCEWKKHRKSHVESNKRDRNRIGIDPQQIDCICDEQKGRFRKKDAWDCGNTQCGLCHRDKFPKRILTQKELKFEVKFKEQLKEI